MESSSSLWIVKVGSQAISEGGPLLIQEWMRQVGELQAQGIRIIWVSSGAISTARQFIKDKRTQTTIAERQALSALGQPLLMNIYLQALAHFGLRGAQLLLTADDLKDPARKNNVRNCLEETMKLGLLPILNENDATATDEIQFGDNDHLSAQVAEFMGANKLILMSDIDGYFSANPKTDPSATLIPLIHDISEEDVIVAKSAGVSVSGRGGMSSKLIAARMGITHGFDVHVVKASSPSILLRLHAGESVGSTFKRKA